MPAGTGLNHAARRRLASVWLVIAALLLLLFVMVGLYGVRSVALLHERMHLDARSTGTQAALQIGAWLRHIGDVVLHTKIAFEEFGPGLIERDPVSQARPAGSRPPYRFIAVINAAGDATLTLPADAEVPSLPLLARALADRPDAGLVTEMHDQQALPLLIAAHRVTYPDGTFAGVVVGALDPELVARTMEALAGRRTIRLRIVDDDGRDVFKRSWGVVGVGADPAQVDRIAIEGTPWAVWADDDDDLVSALAARELIPTALGSLFTVVLLVSVGVFLTRSIKREIDSELRAQSAAAQAEVRWRFMAHMSHEIRTPINGVLGASELLAQAPLQPGQQQLVEVIRGSGQALLAVVNDLLDASRIDAGQVPLECIAFDAVETLEDVVELFALQAQSKGLALTQVIEPDMPARLLGDPLRVRQVLTNLVGNAVKFTARGAVVVRCGIDAADARWWARVDDTGIGIAADDQHRLFQPFEQADASMARRFGGTGLGLAISRGLAALMGGELSVQSTPGRGSRFLLQLPLQRPADDDAVAAPGPSSTAPTDAGLRSLAGARVLLVGAAGPECEALQRHLEPVGATLQAVAAEARTGGADADEVVLAATGWPSDAASADLVVLHAASLGLSAAQAWRAWRRHAASHGAPCGLLLLARTAELARDLSPPWPEATPARLAGAPIRRAQLWSALAALRLAAPGPAIAARPLPPASPVHRSPRPDATSPTGARRVLAAEDNPVNQLILGEALARLGFDVDLVADGHQAAQSFEPGRYALVLMDCQMPELDGYEATRAIRRREREHAGAGRVPIIALTAHALAGDRQRCLAAGMDDHLAKPYALDDLKQTILRWTEPAEEPSAVD